MLLARGLVVAHPGHGAGEAPAAGPLDLDLPAGGWLTVRGANGSGKSALLATLAGLVAPLAGTVRIDGGDPFAPESRRIARSRVGLVFQEPETQHLTDSVEREIAFPLENLGRPRAEIAARVEELLALFGLGPLRAAPPSHLSGGEAQRVALAAAVAARPGLLLLDEPTSYLDPAGRAALESALRDIRRRDGTAVVWSACDPADAPEAGTVLELAGGLAGATDAEPAPPGPKPPPISPGALQWRARGLRLERRDERGTLALWGGLDFTIAAGERILITGANGTGKTALLDALAGLGERGRTGELERAAADGARFRLGYLTQFPESQLFAGTVREDVGFALEHAPGRRGPGGRPAPGDVERRVAAALRQVGLDPDAVAGRSPDALSLGERRRVALAGVLITAPAAVLLDEPAAGLDPAGRLRLERVLEGIAREGTTLVVASHDPARDGRPGWRRLALPPVREPRFGPPPGDPPTP